MGKPEMGFHMYLIQQGHLQKNAVEDSYEWSLKSEGHRSSIESNSSTDGEGTCKNGETNSIQDKGVNLRNLTWNWAIKLLKKRTWNMGTKATVPHRKTVMTTLLMEY